MEEQPTPSASTCPYCGGEPEYNPNHVLSANGYTHDDIHFTCSECGKDWACGVPIGEHDGDLAEDLFCDSCEERYGLPHRIKPRDIPGIYVVHMKCPNPDCRYFWTFRRESDDTGLMLFGFPQITGSIEDATSEYGYKPENVSDFGADDASGVEQSACDAGECAVHADGEDACPNAPCASLACIDHGVGTAGCPADAAE